MDREQKVEITVGDLTDLKDAVAEKDELILKLTLERDHYLKELEKMNLLYQFEHPQLPDKTKVKQKGTIGFTNEK